MDTKLKGDIAEQAVVLYALKQVFISYGSEIHLVETVKRQRKPKSGDYRNAWHLVLHRAASKEISG